MNYYITTAIPYVNADPHIGFAMELIQADVLARYARQQGKPVIFSTGSDEHGGKIAEKAKENNMDPKAFTDQVSEKFRELGKLLNVTNDRFIRTTDRTHEERAALIWKALEPHIYKGSYEGWYCTGCETFVTDATAKENGGICPDHNKKYERLKEENYFFKLSAFAPKIKQAIETDQYRIIPKSRKNEILHIINEGLEDISISRPKDKISWGIPVPDDPNQVMYVWFEALMNYITVLGYPEHQDFKEFWPANVHVIGKDILRFHAAVWPGMLMALNIPLPGTLYAHGFVTVDGKKMSKSIGNVIHPKEVVDKYGADAFRYFFLKHIPSYEDGDVSWQKLNEAYNNELGNELGNLVQRTAAMITRYQNGAIGNVPPPSHDKAGFEEALSNCRFDKALEEIWERIRGLNQYIDEEKPWEIAKSDDKTHLQEVLAYQAGSLIEISQMLEPFMPDTAIKINDVFVSGAIKPTKGTLFPRIEEKSDVVTGEDTGAAS